MWVMVLDTWYQEAWEFTWDISPNKDPINGNFSIVDVDYNRNISSDRVLFEPYFSQSCIL